MTKSANIRKNIEALRQAAAPLLRARCAEKRDEARGYLRMVEVLKVQLITLGESVTITSTDGTIYSVHNGRIVRTQITR